MGHEFTYMWLHWNLSSVMSVGLQWVFVGSVGWILKWGDQCWCSSGDGNFLSQILEYSRITLASYMFNVPSPTPQLWHDLHVTLTDRWSCWICEGSRYDKTVEFGLDNSRGIQRGHPRQFQLHLQEWYTRQYGSQQNTWWTCWQNRTWKAWRYT